MVGAVGGRDKYHIVNCEDWFFIVGVHLNDRCSRVRSLGSNETLEWNKGRWMRILIKSGGLLDASFVEPRWHRVVQSSWNRGQLYALRSYISRLYIRINFPSQTLITEQKKATLSLWYTNWKKNGKANNVSISLKPRKGLCHRFYLLQFGSVCHRIRFRVSYALASWVDDCSVAFVISKLLW
jgi:hypothetical protein